MPSISPSPTNAPSAPPQTVNSQDDKPGPSKQAGTPSDTPQRGHAGQSTSRDQQPADEMPEDDSSDDADNLTDAQVTKYDHWLYTRYAAVLVHNCISLRENTCVQWHIVSWQHNGRLAMC